MNIVETIGWVLVVLGPALAYGAFRIVERNPSFGGRKAAIGAAAFAGLLWYVLVTDWLPSSWKSFWSGHSITASVICTALGAAAAWIFVDARNQHRRSAALYANWSNWLRGQVASVDDLVKTIEAVPNRTEAFAQLMLAAGARADLLVQQQWVASTYTVFLLRATENEKGLMNGLSTIRRHGSGAIRELTKLEMALQRMGDNSLPREDSVLLWKESLIALTNLRNGMTNHELYVTQSRFDAMASAGGKD